MNALLPSSHLELQRHLADQYQSFVQAVLLLQITIPLF
jgi:hypothetical protein